MASNTGTKYKAFKRFNCPICGRVINKGDPIVFVSVFRKGATTGRSEPVHFNCSGLFDPIEFDL